MDLVLFMREAGLQAAEDVREQSLLSDGSDKQARACAGSSEVRVDVDALLRDVPAKNHYLFQDSSDEDSSGPEFM